jgi:hypothetical protein
LNWTGGEPPVAVALHVIGVPTTAGNTTLEFRLVICTGPGGLISNAAVLLQASRAGEIEDLTHT